ncbi:hypothetical protein BDY19DRAFT_929331 [Irpex rosettiformis]|uniref:Uncharacterized protein n=1 Tax=Irpex rosettiformis TaxID=378272 RepID=A0ACB8UE08_9APHY|nr:hypothetical protein BDY19DRAFT_929331 [Irpex rosettiformis]
MSSDTLKAPAPGPSTNSGGKVKQTRRRQRLSCVECTKRRQRCDRQFPCGLCISRGIPHLCRWEPIVARPEPQRPPPAAIANTQITIGVLTARIATLERELAQARNAAIEKNERDVSPSTSIVSTSTNVERSSDPATSTSKSGESATGHENVGKQEPRALLDHDVQAAAVALAQLSLAPKAEFVGTGSVLSAIHTLGDFESWRFPYSSSSLTNLVYTVGKRNNRNLRDIVWQDRLSQSPCTCDPVLFPGRRLASLLPARPVVEELITAWFVERNWQYGLSEGWFLSGLQEMWLFLGRHCDASCPLKGGCESCTVDINPHWMCLLFSMLAIAPTPKKSSQDRTRYFATAMEGRRYMDDILSSVDDYSESEYAVHGAVLTIIATSFLCMYLAESGRLSEAWKLAGCGLRHAQALGMHRDPRWQKWQNMLSLECELRLSGWWWLVICDKFWSFTLGRPPMVLNDSYDVIPEFRSTHADGNPNYNAPFITALVGLANIIGDIATQCFGPYTPPYEKVLKLEDRLIQWEQRLPDIIHWFRGPPVDSVFGQGESTDPACPAVRKARGLLYQRHTLAAWYYGGCMNLHRPYIVQAPLILSLPSSNTDSKHLNPSRDKCIQTAVVLTRLMCDFQDQLEQLPNPCRLVDASTFTYFIFDGAVACAGALTQNPPHPKKDDCFALIGRAISVLEDIAGAGMTFEGACDVARRGVVVLKTLRRAGGCDRHGDERGELVLLEDMLRKQRSANPPAYSSRSGLVDPPPYPTLWTSSTIASVPANPEGTYEPEYAGIPHEPYPSAFHTTDPSPVPCLRPAFPDVSGYNHDVPPPIDPSPFTISGASESPLPLSTDAITELSWDTFSRICTTSGSVMRPPTQSMVTPFQILQGVDFGATDSPEVDINWARLAGMDSWFSCHGVDSHGQDC